MKAYAVSHLLYVGITMVVAAEDHHKAKYSQYMHAQKLGVDLSLTGFRARRVPVFDDIAKNELNGTVLGWKSNDFTFGCLRENPNGIINRDGLDRRNRKQRKNNGGELASVH